MLRKASIDELKSGAVNRERGYVVIAMCHYPRGISKTLCDEYIKALAPDEKLLKDFLAQKKRMGDNHNAAFLALKYGERFELSADGIEHLRRLAEMSAERDVFFTCQCAQNLRCHRELLLIAARTWFGAKTELRAFSYPDFERRLPETPGPLRAAERAAE